MDIDSLKQEIIKTGYLNDKKIGMIFTKKYPHIFKEIINITSKLNDSYYVNKYLRARVIFLFKYNLNVEKLKKNNKWFTFDRKADDFIDKTYDYRRIGWDKIKKNISKDFYDKNETILMLKTNNFYKTLLGKAKNRSLLKNDSKLYNSIYRHTSLMNGFNKNNNKFSARILFLVYYDGEEKKIKCGRCKKNFTSFNSGLMDYNKLCYNCFHFENNNKYPQKGWFIKKFGDEWLNIYNKFLIKNMETFSVKSYSKISQKIFWLIYEKLNLDEKNKCFFKELNNEWFINDENDFYFVDFKCSNKIIEFDGIYWHKYTKEKDLLRNIKYKKMGYDLMIISENDLIDKKSKVGGDLIDKCLKFIKNEN